MSLPALDPDVDDQAQEDGLIEPLLIPMAQVQDVKVSRHTNGATYVVLFEVPLIYLQELAEAGDGHRVTFQGKEVGEGAEIRRIGLAKDADNNKHVKLAFQFAQSEIRKSINRIGLAIATNADGELLIQPTSKQDSLDLTTRAE
jgi:hypothetical protein